MNPQVSLEASLVDNAIIVQELDLDHSPVAGHDLAAAPEVPIAIVGVTVAL